LCSHGGPSLCSGYTLELNEANIFVWDGNYYALEVIERLGLEDSGGMLRVGPVHYNTLEEIKRLG